MMSDIKKEHLAAKEQLSNFAKYRTRLKDLYKNESTLNSRIGSVSSKSGLSSILNSPAAEVYQNILQNPDQAQEEMEAAYYISNPYASIINYYKTFFYIRYTITPQRITEEGKSKSGQNKDEYAKIYYRMIGGVEGLNLENLLPNLAERALIHGRVAIITEKDTTSETVVTTYLPLKYVKSVGKSQFGTNIIAFNFEYFRDLKTKAATGGTEAVKDTTFETILASMPKILQEGYRQYEQNTGQKWLLLDPKTATEFKFNDWGVPPKIGAYPSSIDYDDYKSIQLSKSANELNKILTHQIPTNQDGDLIMDIDEALDIADNMRSALSSIPDLKLITTFGKTELHDLQQNQQEQMNVVDSAYNNIFNSAGVDYHVFVSDKDLEVSILRDKAWMWNFYTTVMAFYNMTFNNLINFKPYQCQINLLPISVQCESEDVHRYIEYAGAGIGRLQAAVATGMKQRNLYSNYELEEFLDLDNILKPLQSMYTSSYRVNQKNQDNKEEDKDSEQLTESDGSVDSEDNGSSSTIETGNEETEVTNKEK